MISVWRFELEAMVGGLSGTEKQIAEIGVQVLALPP
jgi:hypothetical protein